MDTVMSSPQKIKLCQETSSSTQEESSVVVRMDDQEHFLNISVGQLSTVSSASPNGGTLLTLSSPQCKIYDDILEEGQDAGVEASSSLNGSLLDIYDDAVLGSACLIGNTSQSSSGESHHHDEGKMEGCEDDEEPRRRKHIIGSVNDEEYVPQPMRGRGVILTQTNGSGSVNNGNESKGAATCEQDGSAFGGKGVTRRHAVLIGNLTWWTTDEQIEQAMKSIGIKDVVDVKIFDSRLNGQSKGYCMAVFSSEASITTAFEKGGQLCINDRIPCIKSDTKQNIIYFESQSTTRTNNPASSNGLPVCTSSPGMMNYQSVGMPRPGMYGALQSPPGRPMWIPGGQRMPLRPTFPGKTYHSGRPAGPVPGTRNTPPTFTPGHSGYAYHHSNGYNRMGQGPSRPQYPPGPTSGFYNQPFQGDWIPLRPHFNAHYQGQPAILPPPETLGFTAAASRIPVFSNGNQFEYPSEESQYDDHVDRHSPPYPNSPNGDKRCNSPSKDEISDADEALELHGRNSAVSTAAIQRAVHDAGNGEFASAIETLVTAINLLKNSKVSKDRRNVILINSLQDTLEGIEHRSYGSKCKDRKSSTSRDKSGTRKSYEKADRVERVSRSPRRTSRSEYTPEDRDRDSYRSSHRDYHRLSSDAEKTQKRRSWDDRHDYSPERDADRARKVYRADYSRLKIKSEKLS